MSRTFPDKKEFDVSEAEPSWIPRIPAAEKALNSSAEYFSFMTDRSFTKINTSIQYPLKILGFFLNSYIFISA